MELTVYKTDGSKTEKTVELREDLFGIEPNKHAVYLDVKQYLANQRQGTHKTKGRSEVKGSTRKLRRQKGTGFARIGDIKSPLLRGGGTLFGPQPRDYSFKLNKKVKRLARRSAISYKASEQRLTILEDFSFDEPKTKMYLDILKGFELENKKSLLVLPEPNHAIMRSSRNIPKAKVVSAADLNTYMILNADQLLFVEGSLKLVEELLEK
jgi:large subunit ribosomal protein L4